MFLNFFICVETLEKANKKLDLLHTKESVLTDENNEGSDVLMEKATEEFRIQELRKKAAQYQSKFSKKADQPAVVSESVNLHGNEMSKKDRLDLTSPLSYSLQSNTTSNDCSIIECESYSHNLEGMKEFFFANP